MSRRVFLSRAAALGALAAAGPASAAQQDEPIIDIHQHVGYSGRPDARLSRAPAGDGRHHDDPAAGRPPVVRPSTHGGKSNGLEAQAAGNDACHDFAKAHRRRLRLRRQRRAGPRRRARRDRPATSMRGAIVIAEQKFGVACDSPAMQEIYALARERRVPVLMHWQFGMYNDGFERFGAMLEKYHDVNFLGHAQTWWANIDANHRRPDRALSEGAGHAGRAHRSVPRGLSEHVRRPVGGFRAQRAHARRGLHPRLHDAAPGQAASTAATAAIMSAPGPTCTGAATIAVDPAAGGQQGHRTEAAARQCEEAVSAPVSWRLPAPCSRSPRRFRGRSPRPTEKPRSKRAARRAMGRTALAAATDRRSPRSGRGAPHHARRCAMSSALAFPPPVCRRSRSRMRSSTRSPTTWCCCDRRPRIIRQRATHPRASSISPGEAAAPRATWCRGAAAFWVRISRTSPARASCRRSSAPCCTPVPQPSPFHAERPRRPSRPSRSRCVMEPSFVASPNTRARSISACRPSTAATCRSRKRTPPPSRATPRCCPGSARLLTRCGT